MSEQKSGMGCFAKGCLVMVVLIIVSGIVIYIKAGDWARSGVAVLVEAMGEELLNSLELPAEEKTASMAPIKNFADQIRENKVSMEQGVKVMESLAESKLIAYIVVRGFQVKYLSPSGLSEEQKTQGKVDSSRYAKAIQDDKVDSATREKISGIFTTTTKNAEGKDVHQLKEKITDEELQNALKLMKEAADKVEIPQEEYKLDIAKEIQKAIDKGMKEGAKSTG